MIAEEATVVAAAEEAIVATTKMKAPAAIPAASPAEAPTTAPARFWRDSGDDFDEIPATAPTR